MRFAGYGVNAFLSRSTYPTNCEPGTSSAGQLGGVHAGEAAEGSGAADAVLAESAGRIPAGIEARDDLAVQVEDLGGGVDADAGVGIVQRGRVPGRVERRRGDLVHGPRFLEIRIDAGIDEGIVAFHRLAQRHP